MPQHERDKDGKDDGEHGREEPHEPGDPGYGPETHDNEDELADERAEGQPKQDADAARDIDLAVDITRDLIVLIAQHHQGRQLALALADVDIGQGVGHDKVEQRRKRKYDDGDADHRRAADVLEEAAVEDGKTREHQRRRAGDGDDGHQESSEEAQYVAHRGLVFEGEPVPEEGDAL